VAGQAVKQGEVLVWVRHHADPFALAAQQSQRAELRAAREIAQQRLSRFESLEGTVPRKDIDAARIDVQSLTEREKRIAESLDTREPLRAPVSGVIARSDVKAGQIVDTRQVLIEIIDPARLMVEASTPDVSLVSRLGVAHLEGVEGVKLQLVGAARSLRDGVLPLIFRVSVAPDAAPIAVGQTVTLIAALKERQMGIVLPASAVVKNPSNEPIVWIKTGAEHFMPQRVQIQPLDAMTVLVTQGLAADNRVLVQGAALVAQIR
jgi:multidrug resistance efflux pump